MAQSKSFFGLRRGSTKSLTFSIYNGKQVTKDRVTEVKNPRSSMQMSQRAYMATVIKAYSSMRDICNHSFEGVPYGQKTMNTFISENINMIRKKAPGVNLTEWNGETVINSYLISRGSLPSVSFDTNSPFVHFAAKPTTIGQFFDLFGATQVGDMVTTCILDGAKFIWIRYTRTAENQSGLQVLLDGHDNTSIQEDSTFSRDKRYLTIGSSFNYNWTSAKRRSYANLQRVQHFLDSIQKRRMPCGVN